MRCHKLVQREGIATGFFGNPVGEPNGKLPFRPKALSSKLEETIHFPVSRQLGDTGSPLIQVG